MSAVQHSFICTDMLSASQLDVYKAVVDGALEDEIPFAVGGSLCMALYAGSVRPSRDLDIYVTPETKDRVIALLTRLGFADLHQLRPYDRSWIFRSTFGEDIVDVIWAMANHRTDVDDDWIQQGPVVDFTGRPLRLIPIEELIWSKLYVLQRDRCDWPDIINLIGHRAHDIDWSRLRRRIAEDGPLLQAVLSVYAWIRPGTNADQDRARLIDSREWLTFD